MTKNLPRYAAIAACAYVLAYQAWRIVADPVSMGGLILLLTLAAGGTLLARRREAPGFAMAAGAFAVVESILHLVLRRGDLAASLGELAAGAILAAAGIALGRRPVDDAV